MRAYGKTRWESHFYDGEPPGHTFRRRAKRRARRANRVSIPEALEEAAEAEALFHQIEMEECEDSESELEFQQVWYESLFDHEYSWDDLDERPEPAPRSDAIAYDNDDDWNGFYY